MKRLLKCLGMAIVMLWFFACASKETLEDTTPSTNSAGINLSSLTLDLVPGTSGTVLYSLRGIVTNPQVIVIPRDGLQITVAPNPGGQNGSIHIVLSADVAVGTVLEASVLLLGDDVSAKTSIEVTAVAASQTQPVTNNRKIRTIKFILDEDVDFIKYEYDADGRVSHVSHFRHHGTYENGHVGTYEYPTPSTAIFTDGGESYSCFMSNGKLISITYQYYDYSQKESMEYDFDGFLAASGGEDAKTTYSWTGSDMTSIEYDMPGTDSKYKYEIRYSSFPDLFGLSYLFFEWESEPEDSAFLLPIMSSLSGLNSMHLPSSRETIVITGDNKLTSISITNFDYAFDDEGYVKTILDDNGFVLKIWYTDEPESDEENLPTPSEGDILDVSGYEFLTRSPSSTQLYRLKGVIDFIVNQTYGNFYIRTEDGFYIYIYGASSSPIGYGGAPDKTFAGRRLRKGDEITMVGYCCEYGGANELQYGYVESSYRLQMSDFAGTYTVYMDMKEFAEGTYSLNDAEITITGSTLEVHGLDGYANSSYWTSTAIGVYDDETGCISLVGGYYRYDWYWHLNSDTSQNYMSIFFPVNADIQKGSYSFPDNVQIGDFNAQGAIVLQPRTAFRGEYNFGLERARGASDSQYIFMDFFYDPDTKTLGEGQWRSDVWQFDYMIQDTASKSSVSRRSVGKQSSSSASGLKKSADVKIPYRPVEATERQGAL